MDLSFKSQHASLTLREALAEHRSHIPGLVPVPDDPVDELDELFAGHDTIHCLFGLGTTTAEEVRVDAYSVLASTLSLPRYLVYVSHPVVASVIWQTTTLATLPHILVSVLRIPLIVAPPVAPDTARFRRSEDLYHLLLELAGSPAASLRDLAEELHRAGHPLG